MPNDVCRVMPIINDLHGKDDTGGESLLSISQMFLIERETGLPLKDLLVSFWWVR